MDRVKRIKTEIEYNGMLTREKQILARMKNSKPIDVDSIDLTRVPRSSNRSDTDIIIDMRYEDIERMILDPDAETTRDYTDPAVLDRIEQQARQADIEDANRRREEYNKAAKKARTHYDKMIGLLEDRGYEIDRPAEF